MKLIYTLLIAFFSFATNAQDFWRTNFETALKEAQTKNKALLLCFAGSDWCKPCIKLKNEILEKKDFKDEISQHFIPVYLDFPAHKKNQLSKEQKKQNEKLFAQYNTKGFFPLLVVLNNTGKMLGDVKYTPNSVQNYIENLHSLLPE